MELSTQQRTKLIKKVSGIGIWGNVILSAFKLICGLLGHSAAMISDAVHSLSDVFATVIAWIGVRLSGKEADNDHPYGHERLECIASIILSVILLLSGIGIGYSGINSIIHIKENPIAIPGTIALVAAAVSIIAKEAMFRYTKKIAGILKSSAFMADAWHHRSDALSSIGSLIGIAGAKLGLPILDPIAAVIISIFILKVAYDIFMNATSGLVDKACDSQTEEDIKKCILEDETILCVDDLKTRMFGEKIYVDAEICLDGSITLADAHEIAEKAHDRIENKYPEIKHIMIHVNPYKQ